MKKRELKRVIAQQDDEIKRLRNELAGNRILRSMDRACESSKLDPLANISQSLVKFQLSMVSYDNCVPIPYLIVDDKDGQKYGICLTKLDSQRWHIMPWD